MQGRLTIDLAALKKNYQTLRAQISGSCKVAAMVKANAYGCGVSACASALEEAGAKDFFVANLIEALELRTLIDTENNIYVLGGFDAGNGELYANENIIPVLNSLEQIKAYAAAPLKRLQGKRQAVLHFDTGMNRLGLESAEIQEDLLAAIDVKYIMSHFACSDEKGHALNVAQSKAFADIRKHFPDIPASLANSSGIFRNKEDHLDLVRPGMALYGLNPTPETKNPMRAVVHLEVPILQIRTGKKGETCGYGASYTLEKDSKLAIVPLGYADGFSRALSNNGKLYWKNYASPIRGRVSMDLTILDLSAVPEAELPKPGDFLEVIGPHQSADDLATDAKTIGYEILTSLGARYECVYKD